MNRIKQFRTQNLLSQRELGERLKVGQTTVSAWETGKNEPKNEHLMTMAVMFNVTIEQLLGYEKKLMMTNAERIRSLTDIELAERLQEFECPPTGIDACAETCTKCWLKWLQQPVDTIGLEDLCAKSKIELQECETIPNLNSIFYPQSAVIETLKVKRENENG